MPRHIAKQMVMVTKIVITPANVNLKLLVMRLNLEKSEKSKIDARFLLKQV